MINKKLWLTKGPYYRKFFSWVFKDSIRILKGLIKFIENLIKLKFGDWNWTLESLIGQVRGLTIHKPGTNLQKERNFEDWNRWN
jgi:hypothetical protein